MQAIQITQVVQDAGAVQEKDPTSVAPPT